MKTLENIYKLGFLNRIRKRGKMASKKKKKIKTNTVPTPASNPVSSPQKTTSSDDDALSPDTEKILAALSYPIWIIALVLILIAKPANKFGKFHGYQGLFYGIAWWVVVVVLNILSNIPFIGWLFSIVGWLAGLGFFVVSILYAVKAYNGKTFKVPVVYGLVPASSRM